MMYNDESVKPYPDEPEKTINIEIENRTDEWECQVVPHGVCLLHHGMPFVSLKIGGNVRKTVFSDDFCQLAIVCDSGLYLWTQGQLVQLSDAVNSSVPVFTREWLHIDSDDNVLLWKLNSLSFDAIVISPRGHLFFSPSEHLILIETRGICHIFDPTGHKGAEVDDDDEIEEGTLRLPWVRVNPYLQCKFRWDSPCHIQTVTWLDDEATIALVGGPFCHIMNTQTGQRIRSMHHDGTVYVSLDQLLDSRGDPTVKGLCLRAHRYECDADIRFDGRFLISASRDGAVYRWDSNPYGFVSFLDCRLVQPFHLEFFEEWVATVHDNTSVYVGSCSGGEYEFRVECTYVGGVVLSTDFLGLECDDGIRIYSLEPFELRCMFKLNDRASSLTKLPKDMWAFIVLDTVIVLDGNQVHTTLKTQTTCSTIHHQEGTECIIVASEYIVELWNYVSNTLIWCYDSLDRNSIMTFSEDGHSMGELCRPQKLVRIHDLIKLRVVETDIPKQVIGDELAITLSQKGRFLAYAYGAGTLHIVNVDEQHHWTVLDIRWIKSVKIVRLLFSPDLISLVVSYNDGLIVVLEHDDWYRTSKKRALTSIVCRYCGRTQPSTWACHRHESKCSMWTVDKRERQLNGPRLSCEHCGKILHPKSVSRHERACGVP